MRTDNRKGSLISFYAAGIGVMFLLFSAVGGAGGALLDEAESGTLERLLSTNIGMTGLLAGKWLFLMLIGASQLTVMFLWGRVAFGLPLFSHIPGFVVMTVVTASAAAALGLVLATLARTRAQLSGFSTLLILTMSALGGSMFPTVPHERDDAEDGTDYVQRVGARRLPESVLAQRRHLGAVAAGAGAERARRHVPQPGAPAGTPLGAGVSSASVLVPPVCALALAVAIAAGCRNVDVITEAYATLAEAQAAGAVDRGLAAARAAAGHA